MGKAVRHHLTAGLLLQAIIANGGGGAQGLLEVAGIEPVALPVRHTPPYPGKAICLQFLPHRQRIDLGLAFATARLLHLLADAQQGLYVVAYLMGDDIGLGEIARGADSAPADR